MIINSEQNENKMTLHVAGRLDTITSPELEKTINDFPAEITELTIDMKEVEYISSAGLRVLLAAQKKMNKIGTMKVTNVCEAVMSVLEMTGFADILVIE